MEDLLKRLVETNNEDNRAKAALKCKGQGRKIIGLLSDYVPEEVIYAAGMLPWRITGTWRGDLSRAHAYRPVNTDLYATHVLDSLLTGELDFLDGVVVVHLDDDQRRLWDLWRYLGKTRFVHYLYIPRRDSPLFVNEFRNGIVRLARNLEQLGGAKISPQSLSQAIAVYNRWRTIMGKIYELRKKEVPPLSGAEVLGIATASFVRPKDELSCDLEALLEYLKERRTSLQAVRPRILVSSENLDNPAYLELIEGAGCLVAMDDLDTGSRYFWQNAMTDGDPFFSLAQRYLTRPCCPRMFSWDKSIQQILQWVRDFRIDGVMNLPAMYAYWRECFGPYLEVRLQEAGIPVMTFLREYRLANVAQLRTRVGAFLEMLEERSRT